MGVHACLPVLAAGAAATPLDGPACLLLGQEQKTLEAAGIAADMEKGPDWAKANLAADKLERIKHYLDVKEKVLFRCPTLVLAAVAAKTGNAAAADVTALENDDGSAAIEQVPSDSAAPPVQKKRAAKRKKTHTAAPVPSQKTQEN